MPAVQRKGAKAANRSDRATEQRTDVDTVLLQNAPTKWTDSFILLQVLQWAINRAGHTLKKETRGA